MALFQEKAYFLDEMKEEVFLGKINGCFRVPRTVSVARDGIWEKTGGVRKTVS